MSEKSIALVILGIVAIVVIAGFVLLATDNNIAENEPISGLYSEDTISSDY